MGNCFGSTSFKTPVGPSPGISHKINCPILDLIVQFSMKIVSDMVTKHQNSVQYHTIHFGSRGPKFCDPSMRPQYLLAIVLGSYFACDPLCFFF